MKEAVIDIDGLEVKVAVVHSLSNAREMLRKVRAGKADYHFIEVMACPGGCVGGAGVLSDVRKTAMDLQKDMARSELKDPTETQYKDYLELITSED